MSILKNFYDFSSLNEENFLRTARNDFDFSSFEKITREMTVLNIANEIRGLGVPSLIILQFE